MTDTPDILKKIMRRKSEEIRERSRQRPLEQVREAAAVADAPRGFAAALQARVAAGRPGSKPFMPHLRSDTRNARAPASNAMTLSRPCARGKGGALCG